MRLRQRADYTFRDNAASGRHGWLRLTPSYSHRVVDEAISGIGAAALVLDPFCGSGTTALCAVRRGHDATTMDVNPFLVWFARAKTAKYGAAAIREARRAGRSAARSAREGAGDCPAAEPPLRNIGRWWPDGERRFLRGLRSAIPPPPPPPPAGAAARGCARASDLLNVAFCRTLMSLSRASFGHQSMSFKDGDEGSGRTRRDMEDTFLEDLEFVLDGAAEDPRGSATVLHADARDVRAGAGGRFDVVVTSPPYANRVSYIREMRPYMYWLGHLSSGRDAGEMDWRAIGGTWGAATSRLSSWRRNGRVWVPESSLRAARSVRKNGGGKSSAVLASYVERYFEDMSTHFASVRGVLRRGARVHYIIGNSSFYGVLVPSERIYAEMLARYGFCDVGVRPIRKRNSKKELVEFEVSASWQGGEGDDRRDAGRSAGAVAASRACGGRGRESGGVRDV